MYQEISQFQVKKKYYSTRENCFRAEVLNTSGAWHSFKMKKTIPKLRSILESYSFSLPNIEIFDNVINFPEIYLI